MSDEDKLHLPSCEACGKTKYNPKRREVDLRKCCDAPGAMATCEACYIAGKGNHGEHNR